MGLYDVYDDPYLSGGANGYPSAYRYDPAWASPPAPDGLAPYPFDARGPTGGLRLRVEPKDAQVFVDGYYAGVVDEFDGHSSIWIWPPGHITSRCTRPAMSGCCST